MESELLQWVFSSGGTGGVILVGMYKMWNGTGKKIVEIQTTVVGIDKRLIRVETKLEDD